MVKNLPANAGDIREVGLIPGLGRSPKGGHGNWSAVLLPGESHGQKSLVGCIAYGGKESTMTKMTLHTYCCMEKACYEHMLW